MTSSRVRYVFIDACIVQHADNDGIARGIGSDLTHAFEAGFQPATSDFTLFELIDGGTPNIEENRVKAIKGFRRFRVQDRVIRLSARMLCFYREHGLTDISKGDRILAATCVLNPHSVLYTTNIRDFPEPFFSVVGKQQIVYLTKRGEAAIYSYFLAPDYRAITHSYKSWVERSK